MTKEELIAAIKSGNITEELVDAFVDFEWDFDPYGVLDAWGHPDEPEVREAMRKDVRYTLINNPEDALYYLTEE